MEKLLEMAKQHCDKAEIYSIEYSDNIAAFQNAKLHETESSFQSGFSLRIIKDGKEGFAYTRNLIDRQELLDNALISIKGGVDAGYDFPLTKNLPQVDSYDESLQNLTTSQIVDEGGRVCEMFKAKTDAEIQVSVAKHIEKVRLINTAGTDLSNESSYFYISGVLVIPGGGSGFYRVYQSKKYEALSADKINELVSLYLPAKKEASFSGGKMKVLFMPNSQSTLKWRVASGTNSKSLYQNTTPIADKLGQKIFSDNLTIYNDPLDSSHPGATAFDDEGIATSKLMLVENGVFKSFYYDLNYAAKLGSKTTGNGFKSAFFGGDIITLKPAPSLRHMRIQPGDKSLAEVIGMMDRGVIVEGALGGHSGNIPNGDYSIGISPGLYVENGEIVGSAKEVMVSGNIYETLNNVIAIGDTQQYASGMWVPPLLCDNVSVATKN